MTVILATWEAEMGRIEVGGQPGQKVHEIPSQPIKARHDGTPVTPVTQECT
jgi:hypothetical protein